VEHLNSLGYFLLKQPVAEDKQNNFKLITITIVPVSEQIREKNSLHLFQLFKKLIVIPEMKLFQMYIV